MPQSERSRSVLGCCGCGENMDFGQIIPKPRGCTDIVWLICYVIFCCILVLIAAFALVYGNPKRLTNGMDSYGNICGSENEAFGNLSLSGMDMTDRPHVFFFDLRNMKDSKKICVRECPSESMNGMLELQQFYFNTSINLCRYDFNISEWMESTSKGRGLTGSILEYENDFCPNFPVYSSHPALKRCVPVLDQSPGIRMFQLDLFSLVYGYLNGLNIFQQILGDLAATWVTVLCLTGISFVFSLVLVFVLHWMTTVVAYLILILASVMSIALTIYLWWIYIDLKRTLDAVDKDMILDEMCRNESSFFTYSIVSTIFTIILLLVILVVRKRVTIVVKLFREAGSAMLHMPCLWLQPFITYTALTAFFCAWLYIVLCIATSDKPDTRRISFTSSLLGGEASGLLQHENSTENAGMASASNDGNQSRLSWDDLTGWTLIEYSDEMWVKYMWFVYIFGLVWCSEFILACQQMVIASSVSTWYFSRSRNSLNCVVLKSISRMIQFHIGSIALGSLIITFIKLPRLILQFSQRVLRKWENVEIVRWLNRGCICCLKCFESCMKYVHHNAYTVISIQGVNFCPASRLAFSAMMQNALQISVINSIGDFVLFLAKCITAGLTGLIAIAIFRSDGTLYYYAIPVLLTVVFSYFVAHCVISVFEMAVDTLFLCFCEDHNMNDGTDGKEFYAPQSFLQYMTIDAVDAIAPGRRSHLESPSQMKKSQLADFKDEASPEEIIPMNPYHETTTSNA